MLGLWAAALSLVAWSAAVPIARDSVVDRYVHAVCLPTGPLGSFNLATKSWNELLETSSGAPVHVTGAQRVGGGVVLAYPPSAREYFPADSSDTLYPSEVRVDLTQDLLFVRMSAPPILGWGQVPILYEFDLRKRTRVTDLRVDPSALPPPCSDKPSGSAPVARRGSLITLRRVMGEGPDPDYVVNVDTDGAVRYQGHAYVCLRGMAMGHLSAEAVEEVRRIIRASARIDTSTEKCRHSMIDYPGTIVTIQGSVPPWTLTNKGFCHPVEKLARALEATIGIERWIGTDQQRKTCH